MSHDRDLKTWPGEAGGYVSECSGKLICDGKNLEIITYLTLTRKQLDEIFSQHLWVSMLLSFLFSLSLN